MPTTATSRSNRQRRIAAPDNDLVCDACYLIDTGDDYEGDNFGLCLEHATQPTYDDIIVEDGTVDGGAMG